MCALSRFALWFVFDYRREINFRHGVCSCHGGIIIDSVICISILFKVKYEETAAHNRFIFSTAGKKYKVRYEDHIE